MKLWFADVGLIGKFKFDEELGAWDILVSYAVVDNVKTTIKRKKERNEVNIFLDSGAYSAWSRGKEVDIDEYIRFIKENQNMFEVVANLDVIPGKPGIPETHEDLEIAASKGWDNLMYMKSKGINPLHIFHQGEDFKWLKKLSEEQEYIGISPNNLARTSEKILWLDRVFSFLSDDKGRCRNKTHGFGVSSVTLMYRYPWYSCDSSTWTMGRRAGTIKLFIPKVKELHHKALVVSNKVKSISQHYDGLDKNLQKYVKEYVESLGLSLEKMREDYLERDRANIIYFKKVEEDISRKGIEKFNSSWEDLF